MFSHTRSQGWLFAVCFISLLSLASCSTTTTTTPTTPSSMYQQTNLVADTAGFNAAIVDKTLINAWGISIGSSGVFWLSANHSGVTDIYSATGATQLPAISVPSRDGISAGSPTGVIFNGTSTQDFNNDKFIYCSEDGIISGWNGSMKKEATDPSTNAVYKGLALGTNGGNNYLYVADFKQAKITVYDKNFTKTTLAGNFADPTIPAGYAPFNVASIGGMLYVAYAKQHTPPDNDDQSGVGNGYISIFKTDGTFVSRFASQGVLNSPWGIALAPGSFGDFSNAILVGNFGNGTINGFDSTGKSLGPLKDANGAAISIDGLWGIMSFGANPPSASIPANSVYFTAGPGGENHGLFGYIKLK